MSVSRWRWTPECDKGICIGDCDLCEKTEAIPGEWIPISRRKPDSEKWIILTIEYLGKFYVRLGMYYMGMWFDQQRCQFSASANILAWQPLPEPYEKTKQQGIAKKSNA